MEGQVLDNEKVKLYQSLESLQRTHAIVSRQVDEKSGQLKTIEVLIRQAKSELDICSAESANRISEIKANLEIKESEYEAACKNLVHHLDSLKETIKKKEEFIRESVNAKDAEIRKLVESKREEILRLDNSIKARHATLKAVQDRLEEIKTFVN